VTRCNYPTREIISLAKDMEVFLPKISTEVNVFLPLHLVISVLHVLLTCNNLTLNSLLKHSISTMKT